MEKVIFIALLIIASAVGAKAKRTDKSTKRVSTIRRATSRARTDANSEV